MMWKGKLYGRYKTATIYLIKESMRILLQKR